MVTTAQKNSELWQLSHRSHDVISAIIVQSTRRAEQVFSVARLVFCLTILGRYLWFRLGEPSDQELNPIYDLLVISAIASLFIFSSYILVTSRRRTRFGLRLLLASVAIDAIGGFLALLPNILEARLDAQLNKGVITTPDMAIIALITFGAGFRLSPTAAVLGSALNLLSALVLSIADRLINQPYYWVQDTTMWFVLIGSSAVLSVIVAVRTRRLVECAAYQSLEVERAQHNLRNLRDQHHDVSTFLASATLKVDMVARHFEHNPDKDSKFSQAVPLIHSLQDDLAEVNYYVRSIKERSYEDLLALEEPAPVIMGQVLPVVIKNVQSRFPDTRISIVENSAIPVLITGGRPALRRVLLNLVVNACEGDGRSFGRAVKITVAPAVRTDYIRIRITDDGPGFPSDMLTTPIEGATTSKLNGTGLGLQSSYNLIQASGGTLRWNNRPEGGAVVTVELLRG